MFQTAAGFLGGAWLSHKCHTCEMPSLRRATDDTASFRLSVRVLSASVPGLSVPGLLLRQRPRAEVALGLVQKETDFAEFSQSRVACGSSGTANRHGGTSPHRRNGGSFGILTRGADCGASDTCGTSSCPARSTGAAGCEDGGRACGSCSGSRCGTFGGGCHRGSSIEGDCGCVDAVDCPWRFGDTLTFTGRLADLLGPGLRVRLRGYSEVRLGPLQVDLPASRSTDLGEVVVSLRKRVLPACVRSRRCDPDGTGGDYGGNHMIWESPVLLFPLGIAKGDLRPENHEGGGPVSFVAIMFGVTADPELLLRAANTATKPLVQRVAEPLKHFVAEPAAVLLAAAAESCSSGEARSPGKGASRSASQANTFLSPEMAPEGWVCLVGSNGRVFWHHKDLGPPPWEDSADSHLELVDAEPVILPFRHDAPTSPSPPLLDEPPPPPPRPTLQSSKSSQGYAFATPETSSPQMTFPRSHFSRSSSVLTHAAGASYLNGGDATGRLATEGGYRYSVPRGSFHGSERSPSAAPEVVHSGVYRSSFGNLEEGGGMRRGRRSLPTPQERRDPATDGWARANSAAEAFVHSGSVGLDEYRRVSQAVHLMQESPNGSPAANEVHNHFRMLPSSLM
eukprot:TRINITY_DN63541_c0_g1_i1.p1 TRINITY_DN63541_c0_g1~~TRINITY_DN63541_c0_g1_i1.p1  ORF type:complete len:622 (+),score=76.23 TRINITY_DN63541_c0_g1_i1:245-2110(+)